MMRSGQSLTPLAARAMRFAGRHAEADRGVRWARAARGPDGSLGRAGDLGDYPTYATAMLLTLDASLADSRRWLEGCQYLEKNHPERGGFCASHPTAAFPGHYADISRTAYAAEALGAFPGAPAALEFLDRCRAPDGGFFFTPADDGNKAGTGKPYGSATCDGIRALRRFGAPADDPRVRGGVAWLDANERYEHNPGFTPETQRAGDGLLFYYLAALTDVRADLGGCPDWKDRVADVIIACQHEDGSFANLESGQKEDDPVIATSLAIEALVRCR
jgi:hypothetical protein